jgi:hypothetical protein
MERAGTVVIFGGGPSLTREQVDYCKGKARAVAIKEAIRLAPWAEYMYYADDRWFDHHRQEVLAFAGQVATIWDSPKGAGKEMSRAAMPNLRCFRNDGVQGLCESPDGLRTGHNSGYQAIGLAFHMGAKRIVLLGIDMKASAAGEMHWFKRDYEYSERLYQDLMLPNFPSLIEPLARHGVEVINASPDSAIECFPKKTLAEALC